MDEVIVGLKNKGAGRGMEGQRWCGKGKGNAWMGVWACVCMHSHG